jgi:hypothetical protein
LILTAGEISLTTGAVTATLTWLGDADLNLFVRDPSGRTVSWSRPLLPDGGRLQIDSNTGCATPSDQPVEHAYWTETLAGAYEVWAWYQDDCGVSVTVDFRLVVRVGGEPVIDVANRLSTGQRFEAALRVIEPLQGVAVERGRIAQPSPQQTASEGGDRILRESEPLTGTIGDEVYARFYSFDGGAGDVVEVAIERLTGDLDPIVVLRDGADRALPGAMNDDADDSTRDSRLIYTLPADGAYVIAVTRFGGRDGTTTGDFRVTLEVTAGS